VQETDTDEDVSYIGAVTAAVDSYNFSPVDFVGAVHAVQLSYRAKKTVPGGYRRTRSRLVDAGIAATSGVFSPSYGSYDAPPPWVWNERPAGGAWTVDAVNALEAGVVLEA